MGKHLCHLISKFYLLNQGQSNFSASRRMWSTAQCPACQLIFFFKSASIFRRMFSMHSDFHKDHNMKVIRSVNLPVTPVIFFSFLFLGCLGKVSSLLLAHSFCIIAQTANRILEEACLGASFFWLITGRAKCDSPSTVSQKQRFKEFSRIQLPAVHSSVSNP